MNTNNNTNNKSSNNIYLSRSSSLGVFFCWTCKFHYHHLDDIINLAFYSTILLHVNYQFFLETDEYYYLERTSGGGSFGSSLLMMLDVVVAAANCVVLLCCGGCLNFIMFWSSCCLKDDLSKCIKQDTCSMKHYIDKFNKRYCFTSY